MSTNLAVLSIIRYAPLIPNLYSTVRNKGTECAYHAIFTCIIGYLLGFNFQKDVRCHPHHQVALSMSAILKPCRYILFTHTARASDISPGTWLSITLYVPDNGKHGRTLWILQCRGCLLFQSTWSYPGFLGGSCCPVICVS